jgi:hypothetical protein
MTSGSQTESDRMLSFGDEAKRFIKSSNTIDLIDVHPEPRCHHFKGFFRKIFIPILNVVKDTDEGCPLLLMFVNDQIN